jgi:hypothetical protein
MRNNDIGKVQSGLEFLETIKNRCAGAGFHFTDAMDSCSIGIPGFICR